MHSFAELNHYSLGVCTCNCVMDGSRIFQYFSLDLSLLEYVFLNIIKMWKGIDNLYIELKITKKKKVFIL